MRVMRRVQHEKKEEGFIRVDDGSSCNAPKRKIMLLNIRITCPSLSVPAINVYSSPTVLCITGGEEIVASQGTS